MVRIALRRFAVEDSFVAMIVEVLRSFYSHVNAPSPQIVDLYLFGRASSMNAYVGREKSRLGIGTSGLDSSFFALHDAWRGIPRIIAAQDRVSELPRPVILGILHHEAAHTILHGSLEFYAFSLPRSMLELERKGVVSKQLSRELLYLASLAAKDYEVTRLLLEKSYVKDQVAYNRYLLKTSEDEEEIWLSIDGNKQARTLYLVSLLKPALCAAPLLENDMCRNEVSECITQSLSHLPEYWRRHISRIIGVASRFREDTHENVALLMSEISELCQIDP